MLRYCTLCKHRTQHEAVQLVSDPGGKYSRCLQCWQISDLVTHAPIKLRGKNPRALSVRDKVKAHPELKKAAKLFTGFTGNAPTKLRRVKVPNSSRVRLQFGSVTAIMYLSRDGGKRVHYIHRFRAGSRPSLSATPDGKHLQLLGGAFRFTDRGIVDSGRTRRSPRM